MCFMNIVESSPEESRYYLILTPDLGYSQTDTLTDRSILACGS